MAKQHNAVCTVCGETYWRQPNRLSRSRFCKKECKLKGGGFGKGQPGEEILQDDLKRLYYQERLSMKQIADHYGCSVHKVAYWMERYGLERRSWSEATYVHHHPDGDPFQIKMPETSEEWELFHLTIGIYMGEGSKKGWAVSIANTNPRIHKIFIDFLEKICGIPVENLSAAINIYDDCDVEAETIWWSEQLGLKSEQFFQPTVRASRGGTHIQKSPHGTLSTYFINIKLKRIILDWCENYYDKYSRLRT